MKCDKCGHEGTRAEFKYLGMANEAGADSMRLCPKCRAAVYCDELAEDEKTSEVKVWGMRVLGKKIERSGS